MAEQSFQEKTEPATPKRREEARKKGQVGKSREIPSLAVLAGGTLFFFFGGHLMATDLKEIMINALGSVASVSDGDFDIVYFVKQSIHAYLAVMLPVMAIVSLIAILSNYLQTGPIWSVEPLAPKASKINPVEGAKRIFSKRSLAELLKSIFKILIIGWAVFSLMKGELDHLIQLAYEDKFQIISYMCSTSFNLLARACFIIALLAVLDFLYQKWEFEQSIKMTKQEVKEEFKQTEGDPLIKSRIRTLQREMARKRMMEEVKKADVVITNPQHLSIALRYDSSKMRAPMVVAKGADKIAFKIREIAKAHEVPLVENRTLAQNLYKTVDIGEEIPSAFYQAVAEILAYVYKLKNKFNYRGENWSQQG